MRTAREMVDRGAGVLIVPIDETGQDLTQLGRAFVGAGISREASQEVQGSVFVTRMERSSDGGATWAECRASSNRGSLLSGGLMCLESHELPDSFRRSVE